jgi:hypothetical protein
MLKPLRSDAAGPPAGRARPSRFRHHARADYEDRRAELRSPSNLSAVASEAGMVPATEAGFMVLSPEVLAEVQRSAGMIVGVGDVEQEDPLEQFREVKSITDGTP